MRIKFTSLKTGESSNLKNGVLELNEDIKQNEFLEGLFNESDRSAVIVGCSYLEEITRRKLRLALNKGNEKSRKTLFSGAGPLSTFSARINLLHCLGLINTDTAADFNNLRKLRNHCAHKWETFKFDESIEQEYLLRFRNFLNLNNVSSLNEYDRRTQFMLVCAYYAISQNFHELKS